MTYFIILKGNFPSLMHTRFDSEEMAKREVDRLETIRIDRKNNINKHPSVGKGACFANMRENVPWSYKPIVVDTMKKVERCDICKMELGNCDFVDGKTRLGPWANMCLDCYKLLGIGLGTGKGQLYDGITKQKKEG